MKKIAQLGGPHSTSYKNKSNRRQKDACLTVFMEQAHIHISSHKVKAHELFGSFTANILKEKVVFTR
ncbi:hypothetical protein [Pinibacter aurantiacus]|uniref:Uncharacterized protein n=1 Tax=Pinibacter aurantiacus TaxID=2851599 RepID=A0A9E2SDC5_9BACT|nr:hypothetical protein [Pinibacter aurantiacus]MBV4359054.1 hypothetical protein [Pinibacter aurantiacus]